MAKASEGSRASQAEIVCSGQTGISVAARHGSVETLEHLRSQSLAFTVYVDQKKGTASTTDMSEGSLEKTLEAALAIARFTQPDPFAGFGGTRYFSVRLSEFRSLSSLKELTVEEAIQRCVRCEEAAMEYDPKITDCESVSLTSYESNFSYANSNGFVGGYPSSRIVLAVALSPKIRKEACSAMWITPLRDRQKIFGTKQKLRRVQLNVRSVVVAPVNSKTGQYPVIFAKEVSDELFSCFCSAIRGSNIYRRSSFLLDKVNEKIFPSFLSIEEHPSSSWRTRQRTF